MKRRAAWGRTEVGGWFWRRGVFPLLGSLFVLVAGCGGSGAEEEESGSGEVKVAATITVVQDLVEQVGGERV